jgi:hypothetical protein
MREVSCIEHLLWELDKSVAERRVLDYDGVVLWFECMLRIDLVVGFGSHKKSPGTTQAGRLTMGPETATLFLVGIGD